MHACPHVDHMLAMYVCMYVCIYTYTEVYAAKHRCTYTFVSIHRHVQTYKCPYGHICTHVQTPRRGQNRAKRTMVIHAVSKATMCVKHACLKNFLPSPTNKNVIVGFGASQVKA